MVSAEVGFWDKFARYSEEGTVFLVRNTYETSDQRVR